MPKVPKQHVTEDQDYAKTRKPENRSKNIRSYLSGKEEPPLNAHARRKPWLTFCRSRIACVNGR
ncbi:hypothetical protein M407DRAFT_132257 [Tulasnella calospora MUT 4182]|uniref:Uncharacterized protein n=1 Tax=Tulasnella calospora MUT 4182 TaxID=1051891 RepID=A0A0C3QA60_9AGAM|nr:hypothetical protein M407DRAFT_132257 [Tulasnella calospora MUT 4182]